MSNLIVAIDGPSASGKSTVSRKVAALLGCVYVDSGSLYRGLTWKVIQKGVSSHDTAGVIKVMKNMHISFFVEAGAVCFTIDNIDPGTELRSEHVRKQVSLVSAMPDVRTWMICQLRGLKRLGCLVMDGRDIGTVVFPETPCKFFLDADIEERARRRLGDLITQDGKSDLTDVMQSIMERDAFDSSRRIAPLKAAQDACLIDTTTMTIDNVVAQIVDLVQKSK